MNETSAIDWLRFSVATNARFHEPTPAKPVGVRDPARIWLSQYVGELDASAMVLCSDSDDFRPCIGTEVGKILRLMV
jgi:hypothetical protein